MPFIANADNKGPNQPAKPEPSRKKVTFTGYMDNDGPDHPAQPSRKKVTFTGYMDNDGSDHLPNLAVRK